MLIDRIEWVDERVHIHLFDLDGSHETIVMYPAEALDMLGWLWQEKDKLLRLNAAHLEAMKKDNVE